MAESQTVATLRAKRDAIAAAIANYKRELECARAILRTSQRRSRSLSEAKPGANRAHVSLSRYFKYGDIASICREALKAGTMTTIELAKHIVQARGFDGEDKVLVRSVSFSVLRSLRGLRLRKDVTVTRRSDRCLWEIARTS